MGEFGRKVTVANVRLILKDELKHSNNQHGKCESPKTAANLL